MGCLQLLACLLLLFPHSCSVVCLPQSAVCFLPLSSMSPLPGPFPPSIFIALSLRLPGFLPPCLHLLLFACLSVLGSVSIPLSLPFSLPTPPSMLILFVFLQSLQEAFSPFLSGPNISASLRPEPKPLFPVSSPLEHPPSLPVTSQWAVKAPGPHNLKGRIDEKINS